MSQRRIIPREDSEDIIRTSIELNYRESEESVNIRIIWRFESKSTEYMYEIRNKESPRIYMTCLTL